jgi:hypothetical protein
LGNQTDDPENTSGSTTSGDDIEDIARQNVGKKTWCNPTHCDLDGNGTRETENDFYSYFVDDDYSRKIITMNCWELVLYASLISGIIDEAWIDNFYNTAWNSQDPNESIWSQLGADSATPYSGNANSGQVVFFNDQTDFNNCPGHVASSLGGNQVVSLWNGPNNDDSVQITTIEEIVQMMGGAVDVTVGDWPP